jgi:hypothetical protein
MVQTQDIFLRALAVAPGKKKRKGTYRQNAPATEDSKWSKVALVFDIESRIGELRHSGVISQPIESGILRAYLHG